MPGESHRQLEYAPRAAVPFVRRRWVRWSIGLVVCVVTGFFFVRSDYFDGKKTEVIARYQGWQYQRAYRANWKSVQEEAIPLQAQCMNHLDEPTVKIYAYAANRMSVYAAPEWRQFAKLSQVYPLWRAEGTVFLHERKNHHGESRLAVVLAEPPGPASGTGEVTIRAYAIVPGGPNTAPLNLNDTTGDSIAGVFMTATIYSWCPGPNGCEPLYLQYSGGESFAKDI